MQHRPVRSYVLREGRLTKGQQRALDVLYPQFGLSCDPDVPLDFDQVFGRCGPLVMEIGFGDGEALFEMAHRYPDHNFLGAEVHRPGVGSLLLKIERDQLTNIRVFCADGVEVLRNCIASDSLQRCHLFFPDPWHKKKHNKRRILNQQFVELVGSRLKPGGTFHFATDWQDYAEQSLEKLEQSSLTNIFGQGNYAPSPSLRPETKFERRGHRLGHGVWDILMEKT